MASAEGCWYCRSLVWAHRVGVKPARPRGHESYSRGCRATEGGENDASRRYCGQGSRDTPTGRGMDAATNQSLYLAANDLCQQLQIELPRISFIHHSPPTGEEEPVLEPVTATRPSNGKSASSPPTPIDKSS